jgi:hypothetical protein
MSEISDVAGNAADGIVRGVVDQSLFSGAYTSVEDTETVYAFNLDTSTGAIDFTDYTVQCTSGIADSFLPWSTDGQFSAGDALYIASAEDVTEIRFTISTPGVWVGGGLDILDSTDGATPNRTLTGVSDASNGFRNGPGTYVITWTDPAIPRVAWSPVPGFIAARKWIVIRPSGYISSTTSPKMSMTYCLGLGIDFEVKTAIYNAPMADGTFAAGTNVVYKVGEASGLTL